jgi:hypothetical protein
MINDDELILYYYRELDAPEQARIGAALAEQPELARRLHLLVSKLDAAAAVPEVAVPGQVQQRWRAALDQAARTGEQAVQPSRRIPSPLRWQLAAAAVVVAALAFGILHVMQPTMGPPTNPPPPTANADEASAYENGLKFHLASTERRLASLGDATPQERARLVDAIIGQNRIYALAAERAGEPQLARVLRAFTPVLEDLANGNSQSTAASIDQLNFELRVMQARLGAGKTQPNVL